MGCVFALLFLSDYLWFCTLFIRNSQWAMAGTVCATFRVNFMIERLSNSNYELLVCKKNSHQRETYVHMLGIFRHFHFQWMTNERNGGFDYITADSNSILWLMIWRLKTIYICLQRMESVSIACPMVRRFV